MGDGKTRSKRAVQLLTVSYEQAERAPFTGVYAPYLTSQGFTAPADGRRALEECFSIIADAYSRRGGDVDFVMVESNDLSTLFQGAQWFFEDVLAEALAVKGHYGVKVTGVQDGSRDDLVKKVYEAGDSIEERFVDGKHAPYRQERLLSGSFLLYKIEKEE